jgi:putative SOS response-associated peptidase YedK
MCYRFFLKAADLKASAAKLGAALRKEFGTRHNIAPGTRIPGVRRKPKSPDRELVSLHWGLVPRWSREAELRSSAQRANARAESLLEKPSFSENARARRCLLPASGFFEWETLPGGFKQPWIFSRADGQPLLFAGLWDAWTAPDGQLLESCTIVTTAPNERIARIHDRMPVILDEENGALWLDAPSERTEDCLRLLAPFPAALLAERPADPWVNHVAHDDERCTAPYIPSPRATEEQLGLPLA